MIPTKVIMMIEVDRGGVMTTRDRILDAAVDEVVAVGHSDFRLARVAEHAGVTQAVIYQHFEGREGLIAAAVVAWARPLAERRRLWLEHWTSQVNTLEDLIVDPEAVDVTVIEERQQEMRWSMAEILVLSWYYPELTEVVVESNKEGFELLVAMYSRILSSSDLSGELEPRALAYLSASLWFGGLISVIGEEERARQPVLTSILFEAISCAANSPDLVKSGPIQQLSPTPIEPTALMVDDGGSTRDKILAATMAELDEVGPVKLTVKQVARRAGVSSALVIHHFKNRTELLAAASSLSIDALYATRREMVLKLGREVDTEDQLVEFARASMAVGASEGTDPQRRALIEALVAAHHSSTAMNLIATSARSYMEDGAALMADFQKRGFVGQRFAPIDMANFILRFQWGRVLFDEDPVTHVDLADLGMLGELVYTKAFAEN